MRLSSLLHLNPETLQLLGGMPSILMNTTIDLDLGRCWHDSEPIKKLVHRLLRGRPTTGQSFGDKFDNLAIATTANSIYDPAIQS